MSNETQMAIVPNVCCAIVAVYLVQKKLKKNEMEAKNYRVGNIVEQPSRVGKISEVWQDAVRLEGYNNGYDYSHTNPIHLSEKWLNDFGFKKEVLSDDSGYYYTLELNDNKYCDLSISSRDKKGFIEVTLFPYEEWFRYRYVHELQNLFFAITGTELELKKDA
jgi:hypothetical protein